MKNPKGSPYTVGQRRGPRAKIENPRRPDHRVPEEGYQNSLSQKCGGGGVGGLGTRGCGCGMGSIGSRIRRWPLVGTAARCGRVGVGVLAVFRKIAPVFRIRRVRVSLDIRRHGSRRFERAQSTPGPYRYIASLAYCFKQLIHTYTRFSHTVVCRVEYFNTRNTRVACVVVLRYIPTRTQRYPPGSLSRYRASFVNALAHRHHGRRGSRSPRRAKRVRTPCTVWRRNLWQVHSFSVGCAAGSAGRYEKFSVSIVFFWKRNRKKRPATTHFLAAAQPFVRNTDTADGRHAIMIPYADRPPKRAGSSLFQ